MPTVTTTLADGANYVLLTSNAGTNYLIASRGQIEIYVGPTSAPPIVTDVGIIVDHQTPINIVASAGEGVYAKSLKNIVTQAILVGGT